MNTNNIKRFAQETRRKLLEQVSSRLTFIQNADTILLREKTDQIKQLREELNRTPKEQLIEKVAYTWFNRLMALRFMDANDYQPLGLRIITPKDGYTIPELLDEAKKGNIPVELKLNRKRVFDFLDNRLPSSNPQNEAYKDLLIAACNHLSSVLPFLFERINDYTELLLPEDLISDFSVITDIKSGMLAEDCKNVEIIGWLYQFYVSEKKDEIFASKTKVNKEDIPAATQLFTPRWIVEYMVQNTLGKLWLQNRPSSKIREFMPYFIESASLKSINHLQVNTPEEIKFLDPASGSGHVLVYAYELFNKIYQEEGYDPIEIPRLIIENNLYGFEIDERAAQLSGFALMMKARETQRRFLKKDIHPNISCFEDLRLNEFEIKEMFTYLKIKISDELYYDLRQMQDVTNYGSLIIPRANKNHINEILEKLIQIQKSSDVFQQKTIDHLLVALTHLEALAIKYHCLVTNPPYMSGNMNNDLSTFVKANYQNSWTDLMACFMESGLAMLKPMGFLGMINQHSWMFLSSYQNLRIELIKKIFFDTMLHLGARTFPEIGGEVVQNTSFTFWNSTLDTKGIYIRLVDFDTSELKRINTIKALQLQSCDWSFTFNQKEFAKISGCPIGYWASSPIIKVFEDHQSLGELSELRSGISTGDNERFYRHWTEVNFSQVRINASPSLVRHEILIDDKKWFAIIRGGEYIKWYGNQEYVLNIGNNGSDIRNSGKNFRLRTPSYYFKKGITWSRISSGNIAFRIKTENVNFGENSPCLFSFESSTVEILLGILNSPLPNHILKIICPTLSNQAVDISKIPIIAHGNDDSELKIIDECINISIESWSSHENSWDFENNFLTKHSHSNLDFEETYDQFQQYWKTKFLRLHQYEEELNRHFISIYGLKVELTPVVPLNDITILNAELDRKSLSTLSNSLVRDSKSLEVQNYQEISLPFIVEEVLSQFISYAVGCMLGRYSLDKEGLILANQAETLQHYLQMISKSQTDAKFLPDEDNIIPILEDEWFEDDIVARFHQFLKVIFGEKNFNKNLSFIEEQLGKDIRKYFLKEFYPDHVKRYKKRPIYWMFSSSNGSFNVLVYMHRYTPDTVNNILNKYLREFINKLKTRKEHLSHVAEVGSPAEKTRAIKEMDANEKILIELRNYERDIIYPLAIERITIDLDDGVLVNYNKFGKAVKEVAGLNDKKTKEAVKKFDWIDTSQIR